MFNAKNYSNNLQYSERFNYSLYEYYNDYEQSHNSKGDPTKIFYNTCRKTTATIVQYRFNIQSPSQDTRIIKVAGKPLAKIKDQEGKYQLSTNIEDDAVQLTMQMLLDDFIQTFQESNYSEYPDQVLEPNKNKYSIMYYPDESFIRVLSSPFSLQTKFNKELSSHRLIYFLEDIVMQDIKNILKMNDQDRLPIHEIDLYRVRLSYECFTYSILASIVETAEKDFELLKFNIFSNLIIDLLGEIKEGDPSQCSYLVLYVPNLPLLSYILNPAIVGTFMYIHKEENQSKSEQFQQIEWKPPRIAVINLTGKQTPLNLQVLQKSSVQNLLYITFYQQNTLDLDLQSQQMNELYMQMLMKLIGEVNRSNKKKKKQNKSENLNLPMILAFPLGSSFVQQKSKQMDIGSKVFMGISHEIFFLFQEVLFEQLQSFNPTMVVVCYNDKFSLEQKHFNYLMKKLTIISNHRLVLFPDFFNLFNSHTQNHHQISALSQLNPKLERYADQYEASIDDIHLIVGYVEKYHNQNINDINWNQLFNYFGLFLKISSGAYSLNYDKKEAFSITAKYSMGHNYSYIETLAKIPQLSTCFGAVLTPEKISVGRCMQTYLNKQKDVFIKQNIGQNQAYFNIINMAINNIVTFHLDKFRYYSAQSMFWKLHKDPTLFKSYLQQKKNEYFLEILSKEKIQKVYNFTKHSNPKMYKLYFRSKQSKEYIYIDRFTQVLFTLNNQFVFIVNYLDPFEKVLQFLFGVIEPNVNEIEVHKFYQQSNISDTQYIFYSHCFDRTLRKLYLYWPYQWNLVHQTQSYLLSVAYSPKIANKLLIIDFNENIQVTELKHHPNSDIFIPKYGSSAWNSRSNTLYVFGGVYANQKDFTEISSSNTGISIIQMNHEEFYVRDLSKKDIEGQKLRPKINYIIEQLPGGKQLLIRGGYGHQFTNFYNIYSYLQYIFNVQTYKLESMKVVRQIATPLQPLRTQLAGNLTEPNNQSNQSQNKSAVTTNNNMPRYKFINSLNSNGDPNKSIAFLDSDLTVRRNYLLKFKSTKPIAKNFKEIYTHSFSSPEIFILDQKNSLNRLELLIQTSKNQELSTKEYLFPSQDDIICFCFDPKYKNIFVLCSSYIHTKNEPTLYCGDFREINSKSELKLHKFVSFSTEGFPLNNFINKSIIVWSQNFENTCHEKVSNKLDPQSYNTTEMHSKTSYYQEFSDSNSSVDSYQIYIVGGKQTNDSVRYDYRIRHTLVPIIQVGMVSVESALEDENILNMESAYLTIADIEDSKLLLLYSLQANDQQEWQLKIEARPISSSNKPHRITISPLMVCAILKNSLIYEIIPDFQFPIITQIKRYQKFNCSLLVSQLATVLSSTFALASSISESEGEFLRCIKGLEYLVKNLYEGKFQALDEFIQRQDPSYMIEQQRKSQYEPWLDGVKSNIDIIKSTFSRYLKVLMNYEGIIDSLQSSLGDLTVAINQSLKSFAHLQMEEIWLRFLGQYSTESQINSLYEFVVKDKKQPFIRYVAVGYLDSSSLIFFRICYSKYLVKALGESHKTQDTMIEDYYGNLTNKLNQLMYYDEAQSYKLLKYKDEVASIKIDEIQNYEADQRIYRIKTTWKETTNNFKFSEIRK